MESRSLRFAAAARVLAEAARSHGHLVPTFRSPPRVPGRMRTIRHHADGSATVSLVVRERPWSAVLADMIEGFVAVNRVEHQAAELLRDLLWSAVDDIDLVEPRALGVAPPLLGRPDEPGNDAVEDAEGRLHIVDAA